MTDLNKHLERIQEDPITVAGVVGTAYLLASFATLLFTAATMSSSLKVDKKLSRQMNKIMDSGNRWIVHEFPDQSPNAFAFGFGRHIFMTTGLRRLLNQREVEAVLLHEISHNKNKDTYKSMAFRHSLFYLITFVGFSIAMATASFPLGFLAFILLINSSSIAEARIIGRRAEIRADDNAIRYGYGKDLASGLKKVDKIIDRMYASKKCGKFCQLERKVSDAIDEHPPIKKRIETILQKTEQLNKILKSRNLQKIKNFLGVEFKNNG